MDLVVAQVLPMQLPLLWENTIPKEESLQDGDASLLSPDDDDTWVADDGVVVVVEVGVLHLPFLHRVLF